MKKNIQIYWVIFLGFLCFIVVPSKSSAQTVTLFHETMGSNATGNPLVNAYSGFDNSSNPNIGILGNGEIRTTSTSTYPGASEENNVFLSSGKTVSITGIEIGNYNNLVLYFGLYKSRTAENGDSIKILASIDGINIPIAVSLPTGAGTSKWFEITTVQTFPIGSILNLSFENIGTSTNSFRIDDILITGTAITPTPIRLSKFKASRVDNKTVVAWTTVTEFNNAYFEIEKSAEGKSFETIGRIQSKNNPTGANYEYIDCSEQKGIHFYRLKSVDLDDKFEYSWIATLSERTVMISTIQLKTNVVQNQLCLFVKTSKYQPFYYGIYNMSGRYFIQNAIQLKPNADYSINISSLNSGMYLLKTILGDEVKYFKFIKQ